MTDPEEIAASLFKRLGPSTVDEVRAIRSQLDEECGHDLHRLAENARKAAEDFRRLVASGRSGHTK